MDLTQVVVKKKFYKRSWFWIVFAVVFIVISASNGNDQATPTIEQIQTATIQEQTLTKEEARKEIDKVMELAKDASLVTSYEFSDKASLVYVGPTWYTQTVEFKKDFLAKIATLKKSLNGFTRFEVRDYKSNELVGEVKYNSLEVYK